MKLKLIYNLVWLQFSVQMNRWTWSHNKGCYGHVRTKDMSVKQLCVCEQHQSVKTTSCVWVSQTGHGYICIKTHSQTHSHFGRGLHLAKFTVGPNTPWLYLYCPQKHTHTQGQVYRPSRSKIHWNLTGGLTLTRTNTHIPPPANSANRKRAVMIYSD